MATQVLTQLAGRTIEELLSTHLKAIFDDIKQKIKRAPVFAYSESDVDNAEFHFLLSVPQMWPPAAGRMSKSG